MFKPVSVLSGGELSRITLAIKNVSREALNIPAERLMERFVRGDTSRTTEGSGLGLSIARSIVRRHKGTITAAPLDKGRILFRVIL